MENGGKMVFFGSVRDPTCVFRLLNLRLLGREPTLYKQIHNHLFLFFRSHLLPLLARNSIVIISHDVRALRHSKLIGGHG